MADYVRQKTWASGQVLFAADLNAEFDAVQTSLNNISSSQISAGEVKESNLGADAVTTTKVKDQAITPPKLSFTGAAQVALDYAATGRVTGAVFHNDGDANLELKGVRLIASTAPSGGDETIEVYLLASTYTNPDTGGTKITFTGGDVDLTDTNQKGTKFVPTGGSQTIQPGEALSFNVTAHNGGEEVTAVLEVGR
jgi:hypothetical protein